MKAAKAPQVPSQGDRYQELYESFRWHVPADLNIAQVCCLRWADDKRRIAVYYEDEAGQTATLTYAALHEQAARLANVLRGLGVSKGDRVAIVLPQRTETAIAHIACYLLGAVAMPLSILFGPEALEYRLQNSEAGVAIVDQAGYQNLQQARASCPNLRHVLTVSCDGGDDLDWHAELSKAGNRFEPVATTAQDPAVLIYTSGTTGAPKGALIPHSAIIGNLTGFVASQNWFPQPGDVFWSPADWAWTGGLWDALLPTLYFGMPIVGYRGRFSPESAFS
ncbi:MAG TPA: acyl-CoA synthetase, partial [Noviherbaspirillum sp.]|nr:acyl-CoA synthetase [Noviherbaspirillum sp.]